MDCQMDVLSYNQPQLNDLPTELLLDVFDLVPRMNDRKNLSLVCRRWNDLIFDSEMMDSVCVRFKLTRECTKLTRRYRNLHIPFDPLAHWDEELLNSVANTVEPILTTLLIGRFSAAMVIRLLSLFRSKKTTIHIPFDESPFNEHLPILNDLLELTIYGEPRIDVIRLAPNLRSLNTSSSLPDLPKIIQQLPLRNLELFAPNDPLPSCSIFHDASNITMLTHITLQSESECKYFNFKQENFKQLCRCCPLLSTLRFDVQQITSLQCMENLKYLKVLDMRYFLNSILENTDFSLPTVNQVDLHIPYELPNRMAHKLFPNVEILNLYLRKGTCPGQIISDAFPRLKTIMVSVENEKRMAVFSSRCFEELTEIREILLRRIKLVEKFPNLRNLQKLTLLSCRCSSGYRSKIVKLYNARAMKFLYIETLCPGKSRID